MKSLRQTCVVVALTFVLAISTLAGQIQCPGYVPPPPPPPETTATSSITTTVILAIVSLIR